MYYHPVVQEVTLRTAAMLCLAPAYPPELGVRAVEVSTAVQPCALDSERCVGKLRSQRTCAHSLAALLMLPHLLRRRVEVRRTANPLCRHGRGSGVVRVQVLARRTAVGAADPSQFLSFAAVLLLGRMEGVPACDDPRRAVAVVGAAARAVANAGPPGADYSPDAEQTTHTSLPLLPASLTGRSNNRRCRARCYNTQLRTHILILPERRQ